METHTHEHPVRLEHSLRIIALLQSNIFAFLAKNFILSQKQYKEFWDTVLEYERIYHENDEYALLPCIEIRYK